ncbi:MAG: PfkB family carbohydrate kinase [Candidatus Odinarchaeum yellowstonii]|uniref:PfkB family carbohydrate kinase n=1 Tax=Odinarchaeota yellowstonii (strain LCB_4) TaxID=1841599 RepID=A0AAF0D2W3_ODILC|nr:MAG: PfkB family carbohydrate kinase [Candidatus Odinarchaeum yellowstonii]
MFGLIAVGNPVYDEIITPYISTNGRVLSGCSTNAALVAKRLGVERVGLIGAVGPDYRERFISDLKRFGVEALQILYSKSTGGFKLVYFDNGDRTLQVLGVAERIRFEKLSNTAVEAMKNAKFILLGPILSEIDRGFVESLKKICKGKLFLDPQGIIRKIGYNNIIEHVFNLNEVKEIIGLVDFVKPNEFEAEALTGLKDPSKSAMLLSEWCGGGVAIVTLGEKGSVISFNGEVFKIPPYKTFARDPTGAGDSYAGAFITRLLSGDSLIEAAYYASAAASIMVEYTGPEFNMSHEEVEKRLNMIKNL